MPITIFRCAHSPEELNEEFEKLFKECDILLVENSFNDWCYPFKKYLSDLADKGYSSMPSFRAIHFDEYQKKLEAFIRNSKKQIEVEESPTSLEEFERIDKLTDDSINTFFKGDVERACTKMIRSMIKIWEDDVKREKSLEKQIPRIQKENKGKRILFPLGMDHFIYYKLKEGGLDVKQQFPYKTIMFPLYIEVKRRIGLNKPFTTESVAKSITEIIIEHYLLNNTESTPKEVIEKPREIVEKLSYEDIKNLSKYISEKFWRRKMPGEATVMCLRNKGFEI